VKRTTRVSQPVYPEEALFGPFGDRELLEQFLSLHDALRAVSDHLLQTGYSLRPSSGRGTHWFQIS
jgi:hypothetical protein